jgi:SAM-dependent methyltransferase
MEFGPFRSVIDVGCGVGTWLRVFRELGVELIRGVEGGWDEQAPLVSPDESLTCIDLAAFDVPHPPTFDLALSLEVAEHLPACRAEGFVSNLTELAPVVLFAAAVPYQGGRGHQNEQWPGYWAELFRRRGYLAVDAVRRRIWDLPEVLPWYAQNLLFFASRAHLDSHPGLLAERERTCDSQLALVHPALYERNSDPRSLTLREILRWLPFVAARAARRRLRDSRAA